MPNNDPKSNDDRLLQAMHALQGSMAQLEKMLRSRVEHVQARQFARQVVAELAGEGPVRAPSATGKGEVRP